MVDNPMMYSGDDDVMARAGSHIDVTMSSTSNGSTRHMLGEAAPTHSSRLSVIGLGRSSYDSRRYPTPETSRYEPNFMLGHASLQYPKYDYDFYGRKSESRHMVRPKMNRQYDPRVFLHPPTPEMPRTFDSRYGGTLPSGSGKDVEGGGGGLYDWHIPRASLWCGNKGCGYGGEPCKQCQWKQDDNASTCSSINPPPTFTALDNYRPVRPRPRCHQCSCGIIFAITTVFSLLMLFLITGFIIYVEMVLKHQTANVTDRM